MKNKYFDKIIIIESLVFVSFIIWLIIHKLMFRLSNIETAKLGMVFLANIVEIAFVFFVLNILIGLPYILIKYLFGRDQVK